MLLFVGGRQKFMARDSAIYIVDVYVPNEGEPESALELSILRINDLDSRPSVYVHSYIMPSNYHLARIRWSDAYSYGISQELFRNAIWPSLSDLVAADFLKDKQVVCFCSNLDPVQTLVQNCDNCFSVLNSWQEVFAGNEYASSLTTYSQMLDYMGIDRQDFSNTGYTASLKRAHAYIAIWLYLYNCTQAQVQPEYGDNSLAQNGFWPLSSVPSPWYDVNVKEFSDIPFEAISQYFSQSLPDYINWSSMCIYVHDWIFGRQRNYDIKLSNQDYMLNFIFYRLFNLKKRILVLSFYSLYNQRVDYARIIALHDGQFSTLTRYVKEDFASFMLSHLDDFLSGQQKKDIIRALVKEVLQDRFTKPMERAGYEDMLALENNHKLENNHNTHIEKKSLELNKNIVWYKEIAIKQEIIYRCFVIKGSLQERNECIDHVNQKIGELLTEAKDPFASCWLSEDLKEWIQAITGFTWSDLSRAQKQTDSESLKNTRNTIKEIIIDNYKKYLVSYKENFKKVVTEINDLPDNERTKFCFSFMGITHEVVVDKIEDASLLSFFKKIF